MTGRPKIGFLGVGWIGRHRMQAMLATGAVEAAAIADPDAACRAAAAEIAPTAEQFAEAEALLDSRLDGLVIATPSALHAAQAIAALNRGLAVFCQKPLGRDRAEVRQVLDAARASDRLLGVDLSYRFTEGMQAIRGLAARGELGRMFAADLMFHNAYGPDKPWFRDPALSGGGCVMDLGVHLVDLALWVFGYPAIDRVEAQLLARGRPADPDREVEDYGTATLVTAGGAVIRIACSWNLPAGKDAVIRADFYGTEGAASLRNRGGSFYDLEAYRMRGTQTEVLTPLESDWGGKAAADWARRLAAGEGFDPEAMRLLDSAEVIDRIYGRA